MAEHFRRSGHVLRFIEYMDVGATNGWRLERGRARAAEILARSASAGRWSRCAPTAPARSPRATATATAAGEIGVIHSVSEPFCGGCTRARLSADGKLYTCLFASAGHDLRALLRGGAERRASWRRR